jgi:hypothetical protein
MMMRQNSMMKQKLLLQGTMSFSLLSLLNPLNMRRITNCERVARMFLT